MKLPPLTDLQFFVLTKLEHGELSHPALAQRLESLDGFTDGPPCYRVMKRLADGKFIKRTHQIIESETGKRPHRFYQITTLGRAAVEETREFFGGDGQWTAITKRCP